MLFRTEIDIARSAHRIDHQGGVMMIGSCFSDEVGARMVDDGFRCTHNPIGPLFNPATLASFVTRLLDDYTYTRADLTADAAGGLHALDFPAKYNCTADGAEQMLQTINTLCANARQALLDCRTLIITFGTAWVFELKASNAIVGNCHKLPASAFVRRRLTVDEIEQLWQPVLKRLADLGIYTLFTVSPIRHLADGLHGNQLSKATLLLAIDQLAAEYFPAYEILMDDLRDYRYYAADMKHPSPVAVDYVYELFGRTYFDRDTQAEALRRRALTLRSRHITK